MKRVRCESVAELKSAIADLAPDVLFRGQAINHCRSNGSIEISTSFSRKGCIPSRMLKWQYYAKVVLNSFVKQSSETSDMAHSQAILQHYGWRTFYVDATSDPLVAAWFASKKFESSPRIEITEDCWEIGIACVRESARYVDTNEDGYIYAISRKELRAHNIDAVDLVEITTVTGKPRFLAQSAFMIGPLKEALPGKSIVALITAPSFVLRAFCEEGGCQGQDVLFPNQESDPVLAALLGLPWTKHYSDGDDSAEIFTRGLPIPEYAPKHVKINPSSVAFYRRFWTPDFMVPDAYHEPGPETYLANDAIYHGETAENLSLPNVTGLLERNRSIVIEIDGLISHLYDPRNYYGKGIFLRRHEDGMISVSELMVKHRGSVPEPAGASQPWFYSSDVAGNWTQAAHPEQCDCGQAWYHRHLVSVVARFDRELAADSFVELRPHVFAMRDVNGFTDPITMRLVEQGDSQVI